MKGNRLNFVTPTGFRDILPDEASERERITRQVQDLFSKRGFKPIETPTLEVMDVVNAGTKIASSPFKFFDSKGDLLAMRPDVTIQVARMCATRLNEGALPARFRYTQRVFRERDSSSALAAREITQIGAECIGEQGADVDFDLMEMFVEAIKISGVKKVYLSLATVAPLRALLERSGADPKWKKAVLIAYHESDFVELKRLTSLDCPEFDTINIAPAYSEAILALSEIRGGKEAIYDARKLVAPLGCADGLDELQTIYEGLVAAGNCTSILVDFSVISSFDYYTGIVFEAYSPYLGVQLGSGGRYDNMISAFGKDVASAGFAFCLEQVMAATTQEALEEQDEKANQTNNKNSQVSRKLRIAVPKGALNKDAILALKLAGLNTDELDNPGRQLIISNDEVDYYIVRPSDAPAFVASGAADCGICGRDSLDESHAQVVELVDLKFGECRFVVAGPIGSQDAVEKRYKRLGSIRIATKYPNITLAYFAKTGVQVDIVKLHGNIELAPLAGMADRIVDITATGTTLRENNLEILDDVLESTARFFANPCSLRTNPAVIELSRSLAKGISDKTFEPIAGQAM